MDVPPGNGAPPAPSQPKSASSAAGGPLTWGLLLPVCFRGEADPGQCWERIEGFADSLAATTHAHERSLCSIYLGIDNDDLLFDCDTARNRLRALFAAVGVAVTVVKLRSSFRHKICHIWDRLAQQSVADGCDLFVLLGDDIRFLTPGWKPEVESRFRGIARDRGLPLGVACVCFRDVSFPVFPTFPIMHRNHLDVFGSLFPPAFINQHGDPFLFELYRRWGASEFAPAASLDNTVGGASTARYQKQGVHWRDAVLSKAIDELDSWLQAQDAGDGAAAAAAAAARVYCLNVVVPSYRCDVRMLQALTRLRVSPANAVVSKDPMPGEGAGAGTDGWGGGADGCFPASTRPRPRASLHTLLVVDDPSSPALAAVQALQDYSPHHLVRVYVQPRNMGASLSRNAGMAQSFGDWTVLFDDDVVPEPNVLDAYLGAIIRHPNAKIYVGLTELPEPRTLMQHALVASQMTFFYGVARRMRHPPWGVTANICVPGRSNSHVWFSDVYPRSGGGEDVDFCIRVKNLQPPYERDEAVVAVPEARVLHPFWRDIIGQIAGWAKGDVRCLEALPHNTFSALPNWAEALLLAAMCLPWLVALQALARWLLIALVSVLSSELALGVTAVMAHVPKDLPPLRRLRIAALATMPALAQDAARLSTKLWRGRLLSQAFRHMDWMDGQGNHVVATRFALLVRNLVWSLALCALALATAPCGPGCCSGAAGARWLAGLCTALVAGILFFWTRSQRFDVAQYKYHYMRTLPPLPIHGIHAATPSTATSPPTPVPGPPAPPLGPQPFVVLAYQRTGSNLLCGILHNHPHICMHNEVFNDAKIYSYKQQQGPGPRRNPHSASSPAGAGSSGAPAPGSAGALSDPLARWTVFSRDHNPERFLVDMYGSVPKARRVRAGSGQDGSTVCVEEPARAIGFKLFPEHWTRDRTPVLQRLLVDPKVKKVVLRRDNHLDVYASKLRADKTGSYMAQPLDGVSLCIDPAAFQDFIHNYDEVYEYYETLLVGQGGGSVHRVTYEDLASCDSEAHAASVRRLLAFLGVDSDHVPHALSCTVKQTREPLQAHIVNYEELRYAFSTTKAAACFR